MDTAERSSTVVPPGAGRSLVVTGGIATCKLSGRETGGSYSLYEFATEPEHGPRPHIHHAQDEDFYILEGEAEFRVGAETIPAGPGTFVRVPRGTVHCFTGMGERPCRMLILLTPPGGVEDFWDEVGIPITDQVAPLPPPPGSTNFEKVRAIARRHQMEFAVPEEITGV